MNSTIRRAALLLATCLAAVPGAALAQSHAGHGHAPDDAAEGAERDRSPEQCALHGGQVVVTKAHAFEMVVSHGGVELYIYDADHGPSTVRNAEGTIRFALAGGDTISCDLVREDPREGERTVYFCPMHSDVVRSEPGTCPKCGGMELVVQDHLAAQADLKKAEPGSTTMLVSLDRLKGRERRTSFSDVLQGFHDGKRTRGASGTRAGGTESVKGKGEGADAGKNPAPR
jgi:hypothetical protein